MPNWPSRLYLVRHAESVGNLAHERAYLEKLHQLNIIDRDMDVPLSDRGVQQAEALGRWVSSLAAGDRPEVIISSPYQRAVETADRLKGSVDHPISIRLDERLREKELGLLNRFTSYGIAEKYPEQAALRAAIGKFYYRPPQGESWADVIQRLRSAIDGIALHYAGRPVLVVCHQVVVLCARYLLEDLDERKLLAIDQDAEVANCSVTEYSFDVGYDERPKLVRYNSVEPLQQFDAPVTIEPARKTS